MITITGATGALNGATAEHLLERIPATELVVVTRDPESARPFADRGVEVRRGDYADAASLPAAFGGADQLLLVSSSDPHADAVALHRAAIEAAVEAGVGRILYTSHQGAVDDSPFGPARDHIATERILAESGVPWTALRNGFYLHSVDLLLGAWRETGVIRVPADGPVSWTSRADAAEGAARILLADAPIDGPVTLTAGEAPTMAEVAEQASEVLGREVRLELVDPEDWIAGLVQAGTPETVARFLITLPLAAAGGFFAGTDPLLAELLGREPETVRDHLARA
ncbi:SDR family oxidoreductase [Clavibacter michiganensis]|uniref:SDR family oxidoreductase n=1 Tax=Clavibacter michiganensis TaxID=28447 RepID=UPI003EBF52C3